MNTIYRYSLTTRIKEPVIDRLLALEPGEQFLDAGCGTGFYLQKYASAGARVFGFDLCYGSIRRFAGMEGASVIAASAFDIPFKDESFDKILFSDVVEHLEHDELAVRELARILKPGGRLLLTTPALGGPLTGTRLNLLYHDVPGTPEYHVRPGYSAARMSELIVAAGLKVERIEFGTFLFSEFVTELLKFASHMVNRGKVVFRTQDDAERLASNSLFTVYRHIVLPPLLALCRAEQVLFRHSKKGHMLLALVSKGA